MPRVRDLGLARFLAATVVVASVAHGVTPRLLGGLPVQRAGCVSGDSREVEDYERAARLEPAAMLPQIELAMCYDQAWRFEQVGSAITKALEALDREAATAAPTPAGARPVAGIGRARIAGNPSVLDSAALSAVLQWEFTPAILDGTPVAMSMTSTVTFSIDGRRDDAS